MEHNNQPVLTVQEQTKVRIEKLEKLKEKGVAPFGQKFDVKDKICDIKAKYAECAKEELEEAGVVATVAGRIITKRDMGKIAFSYHLSLFLNLQYLSFHFHLPLDRLCI